MIGASSAALALVWGVVSTAQGANEQAKFAPVPISRARGVCVTGSGLVPRWDGAPHPDCQVSWAELGQLGGERALYEGRYVWASPEFPAYKVVSVIVYERTNSGEVVTPLLALSQDETHVFLKEVHLRTVGSMHFVEVRQCLNGTGGCWQEFYKWSPGGLSKVAPSIDEQVRRLVPSGYRINKGARVNLEAMSGEVGLWLESDPNCCPSASMRFSLSWTPAGFIIPRSEVTSSK